MFSGLKAPENSQTLKNPKITSAIFIKLESVPLGNRLWITKTVSRRVTIRPHLPWYKDFHPGNSRSAALLRNLRQIRQNAITVQARSAGQPESLCVNHAENLRRLRLGARAKRVLWRRNTRPPNRGTFRPASCAKIRLRNAVRLEPREDPVVRRCTPPCKHSSRPVSGIATGMLRRCSIT